MAKSKAFDEAAALAFLKKRGYVVKREAKYLKHTFEVEESVYQAFRSCQEALGLKVKDAINIALTEWLERRVKKI